MTLSAPTSLAAVTTVVGTTTATTPSFTPTANALILLLVVGGAGVDPSYTISDTLGGLAWTVVQQPNASGDTAAIAYAIAPGSPTAGTITATASSGAGNTTIRPYQVTGNLSSGPVGATGGASVASIGLSASPAAGSLVVSVVGQYSGSPAAWTDPTGYVNLIPFAGLGFSTSWQAAYKNGGAASPINWTGGAGALVGVAIEVLATAPPAPAVRRSQRPVGASVAVLRSGLI